jgi:membrane protein YqaA with SNARE-associated domain
MLKTAASLLFAKPSAPAAETINLRRWFILFLLYLILLAAVALAGIRAWSADNDPTMLRLWLAALYVFYLSLCCNFFPAPTAWIILLMASPVVALFDPAAVSHATGWSDAAARRIAPLLSVSMVAVLGAAATTMANLNEYHIFTFLLRFNRVRKIRETRLYLWARKAFDVSPFALLTLVCFIPLPIDVVRWLAVTANYPRARFALANFIGRLLRYLILAGAAACFNIGWRGILFIQLALILLIVLRYIPKLIGKIKTPPQNIITHSEGCPLC